MLLEVKMNINVNDPNLTVTKVEDLLEDFVYDGLNGEFIKGEITKIHDGGWDEKDNNETTPYPVFRDNSSTNCGISSVTRPPIPPIHSNK